MKSDKLNGSVSNGLSNGAVQNNNNNNHVKNGHANGSPQSNGHGVKFGPGLVKRNGAGVKGGPMGALLTGLKLIAVLPMSIVYILESLVRTITPRRLKRRSIDGETVLITGGGSGLGRLLAIRLAMRGAFIIIWGRNEARE